MSERHRAPDDPLEWLRRARSSLAKARGAAQIPDVCLEDLCFDAQQAVERALKALLIHLGKPFPHVHDLALLLDKLEAANLGVPDEIKQAAVLTDYAVATRYPGAFEPVTSSEYEEAVRLAERVVEWAAGLLGKQ